MKITVETTYPDQSAVQEGLRVAGVETAFLIHRFHDPVKITLAELSACVEAAQRQGIKFKESADQFHKLAKENAILRTFISETLIHKFSGGFVVKPEVKGTEDTHYESRALAEKCLMEAIGVSVPPRPKT